MEDAQTAIPPVPAERKHQVAHSVSPLSPKTLSEHITSVRHFFPFSLLCLSIRFARKRSESQERKGRTFESLKGVR